MKPYLLTAALLLGLIHSPRASAEAIYSKVRINLTSTDEIRVLRENGIQIEHFVGNVTDGIEVVLNPGEIQALTGTGVPFTILVPNLAEEISGRPPFSPAGRAEALRAATLDKVEGFGFGSMGGFYTFDEVVEQLDSMTLLYPALITPKSSIGTSHEGRDIWMVKISDNPGIDESPTESAVYYDALHHAREPAGMASTLYYMFWLLENYGSDPVATYLVDTREIFFVPVVNPDGYAYNEQTNPNGGGFWRKNRRQNGGGCFGVDLNRNYSFGYGNNNGSSPDPCDDTYRGPNAFSEPETQAVRDLLAAVEPAIGFSTHTFGEKFLNPYGYTEEAPEYEIYSEFSSDFVSGSEYLYGITYEMLGYFSSGTTRDYLHSEGTYGWTPELGEEFWPSPSQIIPIASENLPRFRYLTWVSGAFADFQNLQPLGAAIPGDTLDFTVAVKNRGLTREAVDVTVTVSTSYAHAVPVTDAGDYMTIPARTISTNGRTPFRFLITPDAALLDEIPIIVQIGQEGVVTAVDTVTLLVGDRLVLFEDDAESGRSMWTVSGQGQDWDTTFVDFYNGSHSFADSRYGNAENNTNSYLTAVSGVDLSTAVNPRLEFSAKWSIEEDFDFTRVQISTNNGSNWLNLPGLYTTTFNGQPSYMSSQHWIRERIDLTPYAGSTIQLRFHHDTDGGVPGDGFYFDDLVVAEYVGSSIPCDSIDLFQARCVSGGTIQARAVLLNSTGYAGDEVIISVDGVDYPITIGTNGTHSRAALQLPGQAPGAHTVELVKPAGCFNPVEIVCPSGLAKADEDWPWNDGWGEYALTTEGEKVIPVIAYLSQNYPNPFNPSTTISYGLPEKSHVRLEVFNLLGERVALLVDREQEAAYHSVVFDGRGLASGIYIYRMTALHTEGLRPDRAVDDPSGGQAGTFTDMRKLVLIR